MNKLIFLFGLVMLNGLVLFRTDVFALDSSCTQAEQIRLRQLASATQLTYDFYKETDDEGTYEGYKVTISNFTADFYVYDKDSASFFGYQGSPSVTVKNYNGGFTYKFPFFASSTSPCADMPILTKNLQLIPYNPYSADPLCVGHETYELCKKFTPIKISSQSDFEQRVKQYIRSLEKPIVEDPIVEEKPYNKNILEVIIEFMGKYYFVILPPIIVLGIISIIVIEVRRRRRSLL